MPCLKPLLPRKMPPDKAFSALWGSTGSYPWRALGYQLKRCPFSVEPKSLPGWGATVFATKAIIS